MNAKNSTGEERRRDPALNDLDLMPFGKFKGQHMQDVPASYLSWLWHNGAKAERTPVANYIYNSRTALNEELENSNSEPIC